MEQDTQHGVVLSFTSGEVHMVMEDEAHWPLPVEAIQRSALLQNLVDENASQDLQIPLSSQAFKAWLLFEGQGRDADSEAERVKVLQVSNDRCEAYMRALHPHRCRKH